MTLLHCKVKESKFIFEEKKDVSVCKYGANLNGE